MDYKKVFRKALISVPVISALVLWCVREQSLPVIENENKEIKKRSITCSSDVSESHSTDVESKKEIFESCLFKKAFETLALSSNMVPANAYFDACKICEEISDRVHGREAFELYDYLLDLAIAQKVTVEDYNQRQCLYSKLWFLSKCAFSYAQLEQGNDYAYWDKIFKFYAKYTNEIASVENELSKVDRLKWNRLMVLKGGYLHGIKGELKTWVRVMRDFEFPKMSKNYTAEQKADILRRFKEVEKYTVTPPHFPGGRSAK